jgi:hypothetical protein
MAEGENARKHLCCFFAQARSEGLALGSRLTAASESSSQPATASASNLGSSPPTTQRHSMYIHTYSTIPLFAAQ